MHSYGKKIFYFVLVLVGSFASVVLVVRASYNTDFLSFGQSGDSSQASFADPVSSSTAPAAPKWAAGAPVSSVSSASPHPTGSPVLSIPSISVNAPIVDVGLTATGDLATAYHLIDVGWYEYGTKIGDVGDAVIDGHFDNALALPAVFYRLNEVKVGDDIYVTNADGARLHFVVTNAADYAVADAPLDAIFNNTSGQRLITLITCKGRWDSSGTYVYDHRIIVTAKLVEGP